MNELPVITFHLENALSHLPPGASHLEVRAVLSGRVDRGDLLSCKDLWEAVVRKLDGLKVSSVDNLTEAMLEVSRTRMQQAEKALAEREAKLHSEVQELRQKVSFLAAELTQRDATIGQLEPEAKAYRELMAAAAVLQHQP